MNVGQLFNCKNAGAGCTGLVMKQGTLCLDCQKEARGLQKNIEIEDTPQYLNKQEVDRPTKHWNGTRWVRD